MSQLHYFCSSLCSSVSTFGQRVHTTNNAIDHSKSNASWISVTLRAAYLCLNATVICIVWPTQIQIQMGSIKCYYVRSICGVSASGLTRNMVVAVVVSLQFQCICSQTMFSIAYHFSRSGQIAKCVYVYGDWAVAVPIWQNFEIGQLGDVRNKFNHLFVFV